MRSDHRWPGRPGLLPDESFSSWFARTAVANGLRPGELYRIVQPGEDRNPRDLDRYADDHLIGRLADCANIDVERLRRSTFRRWEGSLFDHDHGDRKLAWLPPAGRQGGTRCFGQQACPMCLAGDRQPYLRQIWRLSFVTTCPVHGCLLLDRCQQCGAPFSVLHQDGQGHIGCWSCGMDIRRFTSTSPRVDPRAVQRDLLGLASQGWWPLEEYGPVYSFAAFDILALLSRILASGRHALGLRAWIADREPQLAIPPNIIPRAREGVLLAPCARSVLIPMAFWLVTDWPHRFVSAAEAVKLTSRDLIKKAGNRYPFAFAHVVEWRLRTPEGRKAGSDELLAAKEILLKHGRPATSRNLIELIGAKPTALAQVADPAATDQAPWGKGRYWKLDGVSADVKAAARLAAHRTGEGVGPWLDALLRRELGLPAYKTPCAHQSPDTFEADGITGCAE